MRIHTMTMAVLASASVAGCYHHRAEPEPTVYPTTTVRTGTTVSDTVVTHSAPATSATDMSNMGGMSHPATNSSNEEERSERRSGRRAVHMGIEALERAQSEIGRAGHHFGGHRAATTESVNRALRELRLASGQEARDAREGTDTPRKARVEGRELHTALADLEHARADMEHAAHGFSGRRQAALAAVDAAIRDIRRAAESEK